MNRNIVVITPVKDEEWILTNFLWACSLFADHILVLDQQSADRSREICDRFPKVTVIENPSPLYNEAERSRLLVDKARSLFGQGNLLVALDADEIPTFPSLEKKWWDGLRELAAGTQVFFEKSEILSNPWRCVRTPCSFAYAFVDDGSAIEGLLIHSRRLPGNNCCPTWVCSEIVLMHFARVRWTEYCVRQAVYCMIENINRSKSHRVRTCYYSPRFFTRFGAGGTITIPEPWIEGYRRAGVDILAYITRPYNMFHLRGLSMLKQHGVNRFRHDPIWWVDWEKARRYFLMRGETNVPEEPISSPGAWATLLGIVSEHAYDLGLIVSRSARYVQMAALRRPW